MVREQNAPPANHGGSRRVRFPGGERGSPMRIHAKLFLTVAGAWLATGVVTGAGEDFRRVPVPRVAMVQTVTSTDFMIVGEVTARTETSFTILSRGSELRTVQVTEDTAIVRAGALIKLSELVIGDKVTATLMRGGDGKLRAVNVTVRVGNESV